MNLKVIDVKIKNRVLLKEGIIKLNNGSFNHVLGKNGVGKSVLARHLYNQLSVDNKVTLIGSYTNVIDDFTIGDLFKISINANNAKLIKILKLDELDKKIKYKKLSDGQKQKIKLFLYLQDDAKYYIFDEMTNAIDQETIKDIYSFLNQYFIDKKDVIVINITHNIDDIRNLEGNVSLFEDFCITMYDDKKEAITRYMGGDLSF